MSPSTLRDFDNFTAQIRQKPVRTKAQTQNLEATISKVKSKFFKWILTPIGVVAGLTYGLHLYNQHIEDTWTNNTINIYDLQRKVYW